MIPSSLPPELKRSVDGLQAATDKAAGAAAPPVKFNADALNELIDAINSGVALFGPNARALPKVTKSGTIGPDIMKMLLMFDKVAVDLGHDPLTDALDNAQEDIDLLMFAGLVSSFLRDPEVRAYLRNQAPAAPAPSPVGPPPKASPPAPEGSPKARLHDLAMARGIR